MMNKSGNYSSTYATNLASNEYGAFGRPCGSYSATNPFTSNPTVKFKHGTAMVYLIANEFISDRDSLEAIGIE